MWCNHLSRFAGCIIGLSILFSLSIADVQANSTGITNFSRQNGACNQCHGGASFNSSIDILGETEVPSGGLIDYVISMTHTATAGGFNMSASGGQLVSGVGSSLRAGQLTHNSPNFASGGKTEWQIQWTAPEQEGEQTLFVCGNPVNMNGNTGGDESVTPCTTLTINVMASNSPPTAGNDSATVDEDDSVVINILANDTDAESSIDPASVVITSPTANGITSVNPANGRVTYTPDDNFFGNDVFSYTVDDDEGATSNEATVTLTVNSVNDAPQANNDSVSTSEDTEIIIDVLANDSDIDGQLDASTLRIVSNPQNGTATIDAGVITYVPEDGYSGTDSLSYRVEDDEGEESNTAVVSITVVSVNDPPDVEDDIASTNEDEAVVIDVLDNDTDSDGSLDASSVSIILQPSNGEVEVNTGSGAITYTPSQDYNGNDTFSYTVDDDEGATSAVATVSVEIISVNDRPVAQDDTQGTNINTEVEIDVLANDTDDSGLVASSLTIVSPPASGTAVANATGTITYTPALDFIGTDSLSYQVADEDGEVSNTANVTITVRVNIAPVANADQATTSEDEAISIDVLANDTDDLALDPSSVVIATMPSNGMASVDPVTGNITYTPEENYFGEDGFSYTVGDFENATSNQATVSVTITSVNDAPTFTSEPPTTVVQGQEYFYAIATEDVEQDDITVTLGEAPDWLALEAGALQGIPPLDAIGTSEITLVASDGEAEAEQTFELSVTERTDADLSVQVNVLPDAGLINEAVVVTFDVASAGPAVANAVQLSAQFDGAVSVVDANANCDIENRSIACIIESLEAGSTQSISVTLESAQAGDVFVLAQVDFAQDTNSNNDSSATAFSFAERYIVNDAPATGAYKRDVVVGDINADGFADVVYVNGLGQNDTVYLNTGTGQFSLLSELPGGLDGARGLLHDLDGDSDLDLVIANCANDPNQVYQNDGMGNFTLLAELGESDSRDVAIADFNGDDLPDVVFANANGANTLYQNTGEGNFELAQSFDEGHSLAVELADFNQDGLSDLVVVNADSDNRVYISSSQAETGATASNFDSPVLLDSNNSQDVAVLDINMDGQPDLLFANGLSTTSTEPAANSLFINQSGSFSLSAEIGAVATQALEATDIDQDGFTDVIFVNRHSGHQIYVGDGTSLALQPEAIFAPQLRNITSADLDNDGDVDLLLADDSEERQTALIQGADGFVSPSVDLSLSLLSDLDVTEQDETLSFTVEVIHPATSLLAQNTMLAIALDENLALADGLGDCSLENTVYMCLLGALSESQVVTFTANVLVSTGDVSVNASVTALTADPSAGNNSADVIVRVNQAPQASPDSVSTDKDQPVTISVLSNDQDDVGLDTASIDIVSGPANGTTSVSANGSITYTPATDFTGTDSFTYRVSDSDGMASNDATVTISVEEPPSSSGGALQIYLLLALFGLIAMRRFCRPTQVNG